jgi:alanyl-tRNA synthetase
MARERGLTVDVAGFDALMEQQRARARAAQKKETISVSDAETFGRTAFVGYEQPEATARVLESLTLKDKVGVVLDTTACYAEMGGQVGDTGELAQNGSRWRVANTQKAGNATVPRDRGRCAPPKQEPRCRCASMFRGGAQSSGITPVTHLLHWALHEIVSRDAVQKGSYVGPEKLTFDFSSAALTPEQVREVEKLVNERIVENAHVSWIEMPYTEVKARPDIMQFFGDKYGDTVRVVQIGGEPRALDGYSMELCGGTHVRGTGEIGLFRIVGEAAIAAGVRRVEAVAGLNAYEQAKRDQEFIRSIAGKLNSPIADLEKRIESMLTQQKALEKAMKSLEQKQAAEISARHSCIALAQPIGETPAIIAISAVRRRSIQAVADALKQQQFSGVVVPRAGGLEGRGRLAAS